MIERIGRYNVDYAGFSYDTGIPYSMVIIEEFDQNDVPTGKQKVFYFRQNRTTAEKYIMPVLSTEEKIQKWMRYPNFSAFQLYNKVVVERRARHSGDAI